MVTFVAIYAIGMFIFALVWPIKLELELNERGIDLVDRMIISPKHSKEWKFAGLSILSGILWPIVVIVYVVSLILGYKKS
ncbi:hypothetical protein M0R04_15280 [Candidatus Dojkabacteria bacterium]|jgi:hypothetical protein|nr:hypothetical protein [Candidatus Dojkabacteria bacterium]